MEVNEACDDKLNPAEAAAPFNPSSNIGADEIDQATANKLRGDAIGDTMYSEVFVLNSLLQFSDLKWSAEFEDNLCFLWDMTEEKDVCQYLFQQSYPTLACSAIQNYNEPRFIEIVVGIFANLLCSQCEKNIKEEEIKTVINLLNSNDPYILIQVMRFVHAISFVFDKLEFIEEEHLDRFEFILCSSTNKELLAISLKSLSAITESMKINGNVLKGQMLMSAVTGYRALKDDRGTEFEMFETREKNLNVKHLIQFTCNLCSYIDILNINTLVGEINCNLQEFTSEVVLLLRHYKIEENLLHTDEDFRFYMEAMTYIFRVLQVVYISSVAKELYEMFSIMYRKNFSNLELVAELFCYFISVGNLDTFRQDFDTVPRHEVKEVLSFIEQSNFKFQFEYRHNLSRIFKEL